MTESTEAPRSLVAGTALVDPFLDTALPQADTAPAPLHAAMRHLVFPGGKRLRPALAFAACQALGGAASRALPAAAAVELLHTYSLVHDDLPCMDDDDERRGRPTVHVAHGEALAVLAGDALQALAFEVLARSAESAGPACASAALLELSATAGSRQLVGGQADDLAFVPGGSDEAERVESVHLRKSAALIATAIALGARYAGAAPEWLDRLRKFGEQVGVAFQIADDLLDREDDEPCSLVRVLGEDEARARAHDLLNDALAQIAELGPEADALRDIARFAVRRNR